MNLIDHYNFAQSKFENEQAHKHEVLWLRNMSVRDSEKDLPNYLIYMRGQFERQYPEAYISIFSDKNTSQSEQSQFVLSILHLKPMWGHFQTYNQVVIDTKAQSVFVKGALLLNNQFIKICSKQQVMMAIRKANNLNPLLSPLHIAINPISGTVELTNCSYVDCKFAVLNNSEKNVEYFAYRVSFIVRLINQKMNTIFNLLKEHSLPQCFQENCDHGGRRINSIEQLENSLFRASIHSQDADLRCYSTKIAEIKRHHMELDNKISDIMAVYHSDIQAVEYKKSVQIDRFSTEYYEDNTIPEFSTDFDHLLKHRVYTKIQFSSEVPIWKVLQDHGGRGKLEFAHAKFSIISDQYAELIRKQKGNGETEDLQTLYVMKQTHPHHLVSANITRKSLLVDKTGKMEREKNMLRLLKQKSHPNIMNFLESESPEDRKFLYTLYEQNQSLEKFMEKSLTLSFLQKLLILQQAAKGLLFLHRNNIIHLDFKPANLIVGKKHLLKLCDFGQSFNLKHSAKDHVFGSTYPFAPPEYYNNKKKLGQKFDIYALGVTIYKCLFSEHIWGDEVISSKTNFLSGLKSHKLFPIILPERFRDWPFSKIAMMLVHLCLRCTSYVPENRPSLLWLVTFLEHSRKCLQQMGYK